MGRIAGCAAGNGVVGLFMLVAAILVLYTVVLAVVYLYMIKIHMNGRILDVYLRVHDVNKTWPVPIC